MKKKSAYGHTKVSVGRTQEAIRKLLIKYGARGCQFSEIFEPATIQLEFAKVVNDQPRTVRVRIPIAEGKSVEQTYRALYYWLKAQFEAVDFGLVSFEDIFLSHFGWMLPGGRMGTVGDMVRPLLGTQGYPELTGGE